jgi:hypothetical protein
VNIIYIKTNKQKTKEKHHSEFMVVSRKEIKPTASGTVEQ